MSLHNSGVDESKGNRPNNEEKADTGSRIQQAQNCYKCGEAGHKSRDCTQSQKVSSGPRVAAASSAGPSGSSKQVIAGTGKAIQGVSGASGAFSTERSSVQVDFKSRTQITISRPLCLYFTQGRCNKMDDQTHLKEFNHSFPELDTEHFDLTKVQPQEFNFFLVLNLEGKDEILEFPVLMIDAKNLKHVDFFHRFVRPTGKSNEYTDKYVHEKYGQLGVESIWHETAIPFKEVIQQFEDWLETHNAWEKESRQLNKGAFITCGNRDIKTKIPKQYVVSGMKLPPYFMEWINLKDIYLKFYTREAKGMVQMLRQLKMQVLGTHHVGIHDTRNLVRVLQRLLIDGAAVQLPGRDGKSLPDLDALDVTLDDVLVLLFKLMAMCLRGKELIEAQRLGRAQPRIRRIRCILKSPKSKPSKRLKIVFGKTRSTAKEI